jgi:hypothetical protein
VALIRGAEFVRAETPIADVLIPAEADLFR